MLSYYRTTLVDAPKQTNKQPKKGPYEKNATALGKEIGYASAVTEIDSQLGLVLASIESAGIAASTVVFFASDNGASNEGNHDYGFFSSSGPLNGFKRSLYVILQSHRLFSHIERSERTLMRLLLYRLPRNMGSYHPNQCANSHG